MKRLATRLPLLFCSFLVLLATEARAQLEGTLFTKPEERAYLDYLRAEFRRNNPEADFNIEEADIPEIPNAVVVEEATGPEEYSFGGVMTRRDGIRIWLNGKLLAESELPEGFSVVESNRSVSLRIVKDGNTYVLLPGQTVDVTGGTVVENFRLPQREPAINSVTIAGTNDVVEDTAGAEMSQSEDSKPTDIVSVQDTDVDTDVTERESAETEAIPEEEPISSERTSDVIDALSQMSPEEMGELAAALQRLQEENADEP
jgi:hypothetical protein